MEGKGFTFCAENPCLGKFGDQLRFLIHVDDVMFMRKRNYLEQIFLPEIKKFFDISESTLTKPGDEISFLRRTYVFEQSGLSILLGRYANDMIEAFEAKYGMVKAQKVPAGPEIQEADG